MSAFNDLFKFDKIRFNELYEIIQYGFIYIFISIFIGFYLNRFFPKANDDKSSMMILSEIIVQSIIIAICVFYIRKICHLFPLLINVKGYNKYKTDEYNGSVILSIVFMTTQKRIREKIFILNQRFFKCSNNDNNCNI